MRHMKISSGETWIEKVGETGCLERALKQNTHDDNIIPHDIIDQVKVKLQFIV